MVTAGREQLAGRNHRHAGAGDQAKALLLACYGQPVLSPLGVGAHVGGHIHSHRGRFGSHLHGLGDRLALPDEELPAPVGQCLPEIGERLGQEPGPVS